MPVADLIVLDHYRPHGAAGCCGADAAQGADMRVALETDASFLDRPETYWPVGSVAMLATPYPVDRGIWAEPRLVERFVKRSNGRWLSDPGADVSFPTLRALALAAPVVAVDTPAMPTEVLAGPAAPAESEIYYMATAPDPAPGPWRPKTRGEALVLAAAIGAAMLFLFAPRRRWRI